MASDKRIDPFRVFNFEVAIDNLPVASFSEVSGLTADGDAVDYREGTDLQNNVRKLTGLRKYMPLMFKRGYAQNDVLWRWFKNIADGADDRRNGTVILLNEAHHAVLSWHFVNAWINKIEGPSLNATGNQVAIESMELMHEGVTMEVEQGASSS
jgi:phage tail-like protein